MESSARIGILFLALAVVFLAAAFRDYLRTGATPSSARRTWLRVAIIFAMVGMGLQFVHLFLGL